jgi:signal transduction histidine kinase
LVDAAIQQTRAIIVQLSPPSLCDLGLTHAVEWLAEQLHREYGLTVVCQDDGQEKPLGEDLKAFLFHATRELLVNTAKHSQAESAHVSLCRDGDSVRVTVADAGRGFDPRKALARVSQGEAFGLFSIRERVGQWPGGRLEIQSAPGEGTHASLIVPLTP